MNYKKRDIKKTLNIEKEEKNIKENIEKEEKELLNNNFFFDYKNIHTIEEIKKKFNSILNLELFNIDFNKASYKAIKEVFQNIYIVKYLKFII